MIVLGELLLYSKPSGFNACASALTIEKDASMTDYPDYSN